MYQEYDYVHTFRNNTDIRQTDRYGKTMSRLHGVVCMLTRDKNSWI